jgi:hypothetical protein
MSSLPPENTGRVGAPKKHHLDRRAAAIIAVDVGADDELLSTRQVADWISVSTHSL